MKIPIWVSAAGLFAIYIFFSAVRPQGVFWTVDEGGKFVYMAQILETGEATSPLDYPGGDLDPQGIFYPSFFAFHQAGEVYTWWARGFPLLSAPFYAAFGWTGLYLLPALGGALAAYCMGLVVLSIYPRRKFLSHLVLWVVGLCTPLAFYSGMFWEHSLATGWLCLALLAVITGYRLGRRSWYIAAGISAAAAMSLRFELIFLVAGFLVVMFVRDRSAALVFGGTFLLAGVLYAAWYWSEFETFFAPFLAVKNTGVPFNLIHNYRGMFLPNFLYNAPVIWTLGLPTWLAVIGGLAVALALAGILQRRLLWLSLVGIGLTLLPALYILTSPVGYRSVQGLLTAGPVIIFSIYAFTRQVVKQEPDGEGERSFRMFKELALAGFLVFLLIFIFKGWINAGGLQWGPRYLLTFYPLGAALGIAGIARMWDSLAGSFRTVLVGLYIAAALVGLGFQVRGYRSVNTIQAYYRQSQAVIETLSDRPLVTAWCDVAYLMPGLYSRQKIFSVTKTSLERWAAHALQNHIDEFYVIELDLCSADMLDSVQAKRAINPSGVNVTRFQTRDFPQHE